MALRKEFIDQAYDTLQERARRRQPPITYGELAAVLRVSVKGRTLRLTPQSIGGVLRPVSERSNRERDVLLSVLVVNKKYKIPSPAFFEHARQLTTRADGQLPQIFFKSELQRVYAAYSSESGTCRGASTAM